MENNDRTPSGDSTVVSSDPAVRSGAGAGIVGKGSATAAGPGPHIMAADTLDGDSVYSSDDVDVGDIKHIMLDVSSGRIAYAVLSSGGFLGMGAKLLAVPWNALTLDTDRKCFVLSVPAEVVKNAPGFDKDHWPTFASAEWGTGLHRHYQTDPYWEMYNNAKERAAGVGERVHLEQPVTSVPRSGFSEGL